MSYFTHMSLNVTCEYKFINFQLRIFRNFSRCTMPPKYAIYSGKYTHTASVRFPIKEVALDQ